MPHHRSLTPVVLLVIIASFVALASAPAAASADTQPKAGTKAPVPMVARILVNARFGAHIATQEGHLSGLAIESTVGYRLTTGLTLVGDFAYAPMFAGTDSAIVTHLRIGAGARYMFDLDRFRPWCQISYGASFYALEDVSNDEILAATIGHGLSGTAGLDVRVTTLAGGISLWLGLAAGANVTFFSDTLDVPVRTLATIAFHR